MQLLHAFHLLALDRPAREGERAVFAWRKVSLLARTREARLPRHLIPAR
jgi:hypothetical protein